MNIIFLDIDGVLNSNEYLAQKHKEKGISLNREEMLNKECISNLKLIVNGNKAKIVVISEWMEYELNVLKRIFNLYGLDIFDVTEHYMGGRTEDIERWLEKHKDVTNYIILDECKLRDYVGHESHVIYTSNCEGLNREHVQRAFEIFRGN